MRERFHKLMRAALAAVVLTGVVCATAFAADTTPGNVSLDLKDVDVRSAIESLFRGTSRNFAIEGEVQGTIPGLSVNNVPFDTALKGLLKAAGLTYRIDGEIYLIQKKQAVVETAVPVVAEPVTIDDVATEETVIDKVPLSNTGATELLNMMNGNTSNGNSGGYGGFGGNNSWGGGGFGGGMNSGFGGGMNSGFGGGSFGGGMNSGFGGGFGGGSYGGGSYGGGSSYGGGFGGRTW